MPKKGTHQRGLSSNCLSNVWCDVSATGRDKILAIWQMHSAVHDGICTQGCWAGFARKGYPISLVSGFPNNL